MSKKLVALVLIALCVVTVISRNDHKDASTFKIEQIGVKI